MGSFINSSLDSPLEGSGFMEISPQQTNGLVHHPLDFEYPGHPGNHLYFLLQQKENPVSNKQ